MRKIKNLRAKDANLDKIPIYTVREISYKKVSRATPTAGAIYLHKSYIGRTFKMILLDTEIPDDEAIVNKKEIQEKQNKRSEEIKKQLESAKDTVSVGNSIFDSDSDRVKLPT